MCLRVVIFLMSLTSSKFRYKGNNLFLVLLTKYGRLGAVSVQHKKIIKHNILNCKNMINASASTNLKEVSIQRGMIPLQGFQEQKVKAVVFQHISSFLLGLHGTGCSDLVT